MKIGVQDKHFLQYSTREMDEMLDARKVFLGRTPHSVSYGQIDTYQKTNNGYTPFTVICTVKRNQCDLITALDLVLPNHDELHFDQFVHEYIGSIAIEFGGHRFDKVHSATQLLVTNLVHERYGRTVNKKAFIPLALAPLHKYNLVPPSSTFHDLKIVIEFKKLPLSPFEIYGLRYNLYDKTMLNDLVSHTHFTHQQQYWGGDKIKKGVNRVKLHLNHPMRLLYFWGLDNSKIQSIRLLLDDKTHWEGSIEELEHYQAISGHPDILDATLIVFSNEDFDKYPYSSINFSVIDKAILEIVTSEDEAVIHIVGLNINLYMWSCGMVGLKY